MIARNFLLALILCSSFTATRGSNVLEPEYKLNDVESLPAISFKEALNLSIKNNAQLKQVKYGVAIAQSEAQVSLSKLMPTLGLSASYQVKTDNQTKDSFDETKALGSLTVPLIDAKQIIDYSGRRQARLLAQQKFFHEEDLLLYEVGNSYIEALLAQAARDIAAEERVVYQERVLSLERKSGLAFARPLDLDKAKYLESKAFGDYLQRNQNFTGKMGHLGEKIGVLNNFLLLDVAIESPFLSFDEKELRKLALAAMDIEMAKTDLKKAEIFLRAEKFDFFPKLNANLSSGYQLLYGGKAPRVGGFGSSFLLTLDLPLAIGASVGSIAGKTAQVAISEITLHSKFTAKTLAINSLLQQIRDSKIMQEIAKLAVISATSSKESAERLQVTEVVLRESIRDLFAAKNQVISTHLQGEQAKLKLLFVIGKIRDLL